MSISPAPNPVERPPPAQIYNIDGQPMRAERSQPQPQPNPMWSGGAGSGGDPMIDIADLKRNVGWLNKGLAATFGLGLAAIIALFFILDNRISDQFERSDAKATIISDKVGDLRVDIADQRSDIRALLEKADDNTSKGPR